VNSIALNTDYVLRTGPFDHYGAASTEDLKAAALERYTKFKGENPELLVSASEVG
jgi:ribosome assembly protein 4